MLRLGLSAALLLAALVVARPDTATAATSYTLVLGDSVAHQTKAALHSVRPDWVIDTDDARQVHALGTLIDRYIASRGAPRRIVVALGTNGSCPTAGWSPDKYGMVRQKLPRTTIVFVTPYRDPVKYAARSPFNPHCDTSAYEGTGAFADKMRELAMESGTCVADWRAYLDASVKRYRVDQADPTKKRKMWMASPLRDGVHPTGPREVGVAGFEGVTPRVNGRNVWARKVALTMTDCKYEPLPPAPTT